MNNEHYFNQHLGETIETIVPFTAYDTLRFVNPTKLFSLVIGLIESIVATEYGDYITVASIRIDKIRFFHPFDISIHGNTYSITFVNSKKVKVIRL